MVALLEERGCILMKKTKILGYQMLKDFFYLTLTMLCVIFVVGAIFFLSKDTLSIFMINTFLIMFLFNSCEVLSFTKYSGYLTFCFTRKKFYQEQVIMCLVRSALLGILHSLWQIYFYEDYVKSFSEDSTAVFHQVPLLQLFFANTGMFAFMYLLLFINSTNTISFMFTRYEKSPQLDSRIQTQKKKHPIRHKICQVFIKVLSLLVICIMSGLFPFYYDMQMQASQVEGIVLTVIPLGLCIGLYFIGKWRFRPEYI